MTNAHLWNTRRQRHLRPSIATQVGKGNALGSCKEMADLSSPTLPYQYALLHRRFPVLNFGGVVLEDLQQCI